MNALVRIVRDDTPTVEALYAGFMAAKAMARAYSDSALFLASNGGDPVTADLAADSHRERVEALRADILNHYGISLEMVRELAE